MNEPPCIEWKGKLNRSGYREDLQESGGRSTPLVLHGRRRTEERSLQVWWSGIGCDNRKCINPDHLELGTQAENVRDMHERRKSVSAF